LKNDGSSDFRRDKLRLSLSIMAVGMCLAVIWAAFQGWILSRGYPYNTFLFDPSGRFSDMSDLTFYAILPNPYSEPYALYGPFAWLCFRPLYFLPVSVAVIGCFVLCLSGLFLLLVSVLRPVIADPWRHVVYSLLLLGLSYPVLFAFDRGNIEIFLVLLIAGSIYLMSRANYILAAYVLIPAVGFKIYPALLLVLLLRQRKIAWLVYALLGVLVLTCISTYALSLPVEKTVELYQRDLAFITRAKSYDNATLGNSASPWNAFKMIVVSLQKMGAIGQVDFSFNGGFIVGAYAVYMSGMTLLAAALAIHVCLVEKEFARCGMVLLLFITICSPTGGDYRLLYAGIALVMLIVLKTKRPHDRLALILLALVMVPKKELILWWMGSTETGFKDISITVFLDPILVAAALYYLLYDGWTRFDSPWTRSRWRGLGRCVWQKKLA
jgi:hypothetical protein